MQHILITLITLLLTRRSGNYVKFKDKAVKTFNARHVEKQSKLLCEAVQNYQGNHYCVLQEQCKYLQEKKKDQNMFWVNYKASTVTFSPAGTT